MKLVKVCALALTAFAALACSTANKETFVSDFSQYPLCIDTDSPSVVFVDIKNGKEVSKRYYEAFETVHPSPLSAYGGFFGCRHFSQANEFLKSTSQTPINWNSVNE